MSYQPRPIDTSTVEIGSELRELLERLAENTHDVWAFQRFQDGWKPGPRRDDARKEHPCLIPYDELPDSERVYDRNTVLETLKAILALGFRIEPPVVSQAVTPPVADSGVESSLLEILADREANPGTILSFWRSTEDQRLASRPGSSVYAQFAQRMLDSGEPLLAYDLTAEGLAAFPEDVQLRRLQGLSLARSGDAECARRVLGRLVDEGHADEETLGILARTYKDLGLSQLDRDPARSRAYLQESFQIYELAHEKSGGIWTGINAATLALILGDRPRAEELARQVFEQAKRELAEAIKTGTETYWAMATLGEAALILGELAESEHWYQQVADVGWRDRRYGVLSSTRRQARLLARFQPAAEALVHRCFLRPRVVVFTGHRIDQSGRPSPRFPSQLEEAVRHSIRDHLETTGAMIGYASASSGSDLLFLEELIARGGEAHVILPYNRAAFVKSSVESLPGDGWAARFDAVLHASEVITVSAQKLEVGGISYEFANLIAQGLAALKARQLDADLVPMAVWDGRPGDGPGGTARSVERWLDQGYPVDLIDLMAIARSQGIEPGSSEEQTRALTDHVKLSRPMDLGTQIVPILFADVVGFSEVTEDEIPRFVRHFLGLIAEILASLPADSVKKKNTWGDGLYCVFEDVRIAGEFALELRDRVNSTLWEEKGLPAGLNIRIALHAGPVYVCDDPVTERPNCLGTHVSHAARIEPITPPGQVFASQAFAALAAARRIDEFDCHYVGQTPLAKGHGTYPTYHVHRLGR